MKKRLIEIPVKDIVMEAIEIVPDGAEFGSDQLEVAFCVHGFPDNFHSYDKQLEMLTKENFRVITPALPGYTLRSQLKDNNYSTKNVASYLIAALDVLGLKKVHYVGHDWGGNVVPFLLDENSDKFSSVTMLTNPPVASLFENMAKNPQQMSSFWYSEMFRVCGEWADNAIAMNDYELVEMIWRLWDPGWNFTQEEINQVKETFRIPGVNKGSLGYYRSADKVDPMEFARVFALSYKVPVMIVFGKTDGCMLEVMFKDFDRSLYEEGLTLKGINAGHFLHRENPEEFNPILKEFLSKHRSQSV